ncbi:hypothetical protein [uncultured Sphingomonas sp.]|uniref:hypothetical protein n=1 Tax=uncultured Sphingomonas sp. TaxID=158754 RepID=UPI0025E77DD4|nr:hypothetical protein [uncultured Sphingomonas sp.]
MSEAYDDDIAEEEALFARIAAAEPAEGMETPPITPQAGGRPHKVDPIKLVAWRQAHKATIAATATRWSVSPATVKRLSKEYAGAAKRERSRYECSRLDKELQLHQHQLWQMYNNQLSRHLSWVALRWFPAWRDAKGTPREGAVARAEQEALQEAETQFQADWTRSMGPVPEYVPPW